VREGLEKIHAKFRSPEDAGPRWTADFLGETDPEARAILQRRVYEEIATWLNPLAVEPWRAPA
jgi:hypothetical protein